MARRLTANHMAIHHKGKHMKIKTEPPELCLTVICLQEGCRWERVCANHETAGDFRSEGGSRPILALRSGEVHCETFHSDGDDDKYHEWPLNVGRYPYPEKDHACVLWSELEEETDKSEIARPAMFEKAPPDPEWPVSGDKLIYKGTHVFWFLDIIKNAEDNLVVGKEYTLKTIDVASSWCSITLKETGDLHYSLSFFNY